MKTEIKFVPVAPKTYEVRYVENKEPGKLFKLASYLGVKKVENCGGKPCSCTTTTTTTTTSSSGSVVKTADDLAKVVAAAVDASARVANQLGGTSTANIGSGGSVNIVYDPKGKK
jgi:hypothetical protein